MSDSFSKYWYQSNVAVTITWIKENISRHEKSQHACGVKHKTLFSNIDMIAIKAHPYPLLIVSP
jgi:hypothetical protein